MKWDIERSDKLKEEIATNEELMRQLSERVDTIFKEHGLKLDNVSYVFEPRVFYMDPDEAPEVMMNSRVAMVTAILEDLLNRGSGAEADTVLDAFKPMRCVPQCGGMDPLTLRVLEKYRISVIADDPIPLARPKSEDLIRQIVGRKDLLRDFSESVFGILEKHGIKFGENEGCVFTPFVFETPIFAQKVAVVESLEEIRGFGPQVYADPTPQPIAEIKVRPFPGIIEVKNLPPLTGVVVPPWWWIGIPAPEMLHALDIMRKR